MHSCGLYDDRYAGCPMRCCWTRSPNRMCRRQKKCWRVKRPLGAARIHLAGGRGKREQSRRMQPVALVQAVSVLRHANPFFQSHSRWGAGKGGLSEFADVRKPRCRCHHCADIGRPLRSVAVAVLRRGPVSFEGRYMQPAASGTKTAPEASALPIEKLVVTLSVLDSIG